VHQRCLTLPSSGPAYGGPLKSNVSHLSVPPLNTPPFIASFASPAFGRGGSLHLQLPARSRASSATVSALAAGARERRFWPESLSVQGRAKLLRRRAVRPSSSRCQMANHAIERTA
jgi:hypothetical protein